MVRGLGQLRFRALGFMGFAALWDFAALGKQVLERFDGICGVGVWALFVQVVRLRFRV